jgi:hypothetical protein
MVDEQTQPDAGIPRPVVIAGPVFCLISKANPKLWIRNRDGAVTVEEMTSGSPPNEVRWTLVPIFKTNPFEINGDYQGLALRSEADGRFIACAREPFMGPAVLMVSDDVQLQYTGWDVFCEVIDGIPWHVFSLRYTRFDEWSEIDLTIHGGQDWKAGDAIITWGPQTRQPNQLWRCARVT